MAFYYLKVGERITMSDDITLFEVGAIDENGKFVSHLRSRTESEIDNYIGIMKSTKSDDTKIYKYKHLYRRISTIPIIYK